jgi:hypothetical protein
MQRRRFKQTASLDQRLTQEVRRLRKEAQGTPPGIERERLVRKAREAETAAHMQEWLASPGLQPPLAGVVHFSALADFTGFEVAGQNAI